MPIGSVLISPFIDHELKSPSWHTNWNSDFMSLDVAGVTWALSVYANSKPLSDPFVSPIYLDLTGFPSILIQAGDSEVVSSDAERLIKNAAVANVPSELQLFENMFHVFQVFPSIPESQEAIKRIGVFFNEKNSMDTASKESKGPVGLTVKVKRKKNTFIDEMDFVK